MQKPNSVWGSFIPLNILFCFALFLLATYGKSGINEDILLSLLVAFSFSLVVSAVGTLIAKYDTQKSRSVGYAMIIFPLVISVLLLWKAFTCAGKFCGIIEGLLGILLAGFSIIFGITYFVVKTKIKSTTQK
jgi:ABC-type spermidine/putrescine transport system permease subunit II